MGNAELVILSTALSMDLFSVAIPIGMRRVGRGKILQASAVFALFHIVMLLSGYYVGNFLGEAVDSFGVYSGSPLLMMENLAGILGAGVLIGLGALMIKEGMSAAESDGARRSGDMLHGWALLVLAFSVSVDALAAGFSFGMLEVDLVRLNLILGSVIFLISLIGLSIGRRAGSLLGKHSTSIGGVALLFFGGHILWRLLA